MRFIDRAKRVLLGTSQKTRIVSLVSFCFAFIAFGAAAVAPGNPPDTSEVAFRIIEEAIQLPPLERQLEKIRQEKQFYTREDKVRSGDTLATLLPDWVFVTKTRQTSSKHTKNPEFSCN